MEQDAPRVTCPKCGSHDVFAGKKGFSGKKAVAGAVLTGGIGILAGTIGSNKVKVTCLNCGATFYPGEAEKKAEQKRKEAEMQKKPGFWIFFAVLLILMALAFKKCFL